MYYEKSQTKVYEDRNQYQMICLDEMVPNDHIFKEIFINNHKIVEVTSKIYQSV